MDVIPRAWARPMSALGRLFLREFKDGVWLDRRRVLLDSAILLALEVAAFIFFVALEHEWIVSLPQPTTADFASFYAAGAQANAGAPQDAYDPARHHAAEQAATAIGVPYIFFYYPPIFLILCAVLARLPYLVAFISFEIATLIPFLLVCRAILRDRGWTVLIPLMAFPAVAWTLGVGQNGFLSCALIGGAMLLIDRRPAAAGLLIGALAFKPHFGLLIPVALAAGGRWRAFAAAALTVAALVVLSVALFGWETWRAFFAIALGAHSTFDTSGIDIGALISVFGAVRLVGGGAGLAYAAQIAAALAAAAAVAVAWRRDLSLEVRAATLVAGTLVAVPVVLMYDGVLALVAGAWLVRRGCERGFLPWEKTTLAVIYLFPLVSRHLGDNYNVPIGPVATIALLVLAVLHARHERAGA